ncbi:hypothetical protein Trco_000885 [Trichoderma cornu-damae]|uniref:Uncharacterized protein n=1 Tax=Trichoderma cornu-damae TaxID=654480 RepID=A0A9P8QR66_9HYPO|nr:hypothetical protein Trco_000885 [Trichoderma cornu-damae]
MPVAVTRSPNSNPTGFVSVGKERNHSRALRVAKQVAKLPPSVLAKRELRQAPQSSRHVRQNVHMVAGKGRAMHAARCEAPNLCCLLGTAPTGSAGGALTSQGIQASD